jgi:hypothetical protein
MTDCKIKINEKEDIEIEIGLMKYYITTFTISSKILVAIVNELKRLKETPECVKVIFDEGAFQRYQGEPPKTKISNNLFCVAALLVYNYQVDPRLQDLKIECDKLGIQVVYHG